MKRYGVTASLTVLLGLGLVPTAHAATRFSFSIAVPGAVSLATHDDDRFYRHEARLEGRRYQIMRALAHDLDERAQHAFDQAADTAHHDSRGERRFLDSIQHFVRRTSEFHEQMDRYEESPWVVEADLEHLVHDARNVSDRIRSAHVFEHTWDDWDDVLHTLDRMQRVMAGADAAYDHRWPD